MRAIAKGGMTGENGEEKGSGNLCGHHSLSFYHPKRAIGKMVKERRCEP